MLHAALLALALASQPQPPKLDPVWPPTTASVPAKDIDAALAAGVTRLLAMQEADPNAKDRVKASPDAPGAEWPYEGVYRVRGQIPIGYRVGGTSICAMALVAAPGYAEHDARRDAVRRAVEFVCAAIDHPLMSVKDYTAGYDVRGWGYTYGALFLMDLQARHFVPDGLERDVDKALAFYLEAIEQTQIPKIGGWNYARPEGVESEADPSSFMTAATVQTLLAAKAAGHEVSKDTLDKALTFLERAHYASGSVAYAGVVPANRANGRGTGDAVPGAVGRMCIVESTLVMAGRGDVKAVRGAVDAFFTHWQWLFIRSQKTGTHVPPYNVAPYYFMFAHRYAAQGIELLPASEREEYRRRLHLLLWQTRQEDGTWNDRVFPRTANYGTAMAMLSLLESRPR